MRKISILGTEVYAVRGHFDRRHPCKAILEPDNVKGGRYLRGCLVKDGNVLGALNWVTGDGSDGCMNLPTCLYECSTKQAEKEFC